jgi:hypothetical protein
MNELIQYAPLVIIVLLAYAVFYLERIYSKIESVRILLQNHTKK